MKYLTSKLLMLLSTPIIMFALEVPANHIVTTDWISQHQGDTNLILIDTREEIFYKKGHLLGARNIPKKRYFQGNLGSIPKQPNTLEQMQKILQNAGVTEKSVVVFYGGGKNSKDFADAASGIWNIWLYGYQKTALLDGGFAKWTSEERKVSTTLPKVKKSDLELESYDKSIIASLPEILEAIYNDEIQIADARVNKFYKGEDKRKDLKRHGRIPTAKLTPMIRYTQDNGKYFTLISKDEASKILHNAGYGIALDKPVNIYCNTGHKARGLWFISKFIIGMKDVKVYDGSIIEYSNTNLPMEIGEPME